MRIPIRVFGYSRVSTEKKTSRTRVFQNRVVWNHYFWAFFDLKKLFYHFSKSSVAPVSDVQERWLMCGCEPQKFSLSILISESILPNFFLCKTKIFFRFSLLSLAIQSTDNIFLCYKHSNLTTKIRKTEKSKFGRIDSEIRERLYWGSKQQQ